MKLVDFFFELVKMKIVEMIIMNFFFNFFCDNVNEIIFS